MFRRKQKPSDFNPGIDAHLQLEAERLRDEGLSEEDAQRAARRVFGNVTRAQERFYKSGRWIGWDRLWQDVRFGLRMLAKSPALTLIVAITLALGIGVNTAIFSVLNGWLLRPLPVRAPEQITVLALRQKEASRGSQFSYLDLLDFQKQAATFSDLFAYASGRA